MRKGLFIELKNKDKRDNKDGRWAISCLYVKRLVDF